MLDRLGLNRLGALAVFVTSAVLLSSGWAQQTGTASATEGAGAAAGQETQEFVKEAASDGMAEVALGLMAQEQAASDQVKQFGQRMVEDHRAANKELLALATQKGIAPSTELMPKHQELVDKLSNLSGQEFDHAYMEAMVKDHTEAVQKFEQQAENGQDPEIKNFAAKTLPTLREHLDMAKDIAKQTGGS